jgi:dGTPase
MMQWEQLLSLKDKAIQVKITKEQDDTRLGFEVDYDKLFSLQISLASR